jgi:Tat protein translocase TatB subunit
MFGMGLSEILIIAAIALIFLGPEKFPEFAKLAVRTVRDLRGYMDEMKTEIAKEVRPISSELKQLSKYDPEKYIDSLSPKKTAEKKTEAKPEAEAAGDAPEAQPAEGAQPYASGDFGESESDIGAAPAAEDTSAAPPPPEAEPADDRREDKFPD